jgi:hypothetical protein
VGVQLRYDNVMDMELTRTKNRTIVTNRIMLGDVAEFNGGAYWTQQLSLTKNLEVTGGLRADYFTNRYNDELAMQVLQSRSSIVSPKLNLAYRVNDKVQFYLGTTAAGFTATTPA